MRDYNQESRDTGDRKYAYGFDFDVMHGFMMRAFERFFQPGKVLELGSFRGDFTERLAGRFPHVTCVEASEEAVREARVRMGGKATVVTSTFEAAKLDGQFEN